MSAPVWYFHSPLSAVSSTLTYQSSRDRSVTKSLDAEAAWWLRSSSLKVVCKFAWINGPTWNQALHITLSSFPISFFKTFGLLLHGSYIGFGIIQNTLVDGETILIALFCHPEDKRGRLPTTSWKRADYRAHVSFVSVSIKRFGVQNLGTLSEITGIILKKLRKSF